MKILITGTNGQVGNALLKTLANHELIPITRKDCDLTSVDQIKEIIDKHKLDLIINPAAYTKVDLAEDETKQAFQINRNAPILMASKAKELNIPIIHFSTDYIFDGTNEGGYCEDDSPNPLNVYGKSKLEGEDGIQEVGGQYYIFRTSWVYSNIGHNFFLTMKKLGYEKEVLNIVADQIGSPTSNLFIAEQIKKIIPQLNNSNSGVYHLVPDSFCSWHEFAKAIIRKTNPNFNLEQLYAIKSIEFPTKAVRPKYSILINNKIKNKFKLTFESWQEELEKIIYE